MGLFEPSEYVPLWDLPPAPEPEPDHDVADESKDPSLNRLQRSLIWFAAVLIAVSMFENIRNNF